MSNQSTNLIICLIQCGAINTKTGKVDLNKVGNQAPENYNGDDESMNFITSANADIKAIARDKNVSFDELAVAYHISVQELIKSLNRELPSGTKQHMIATINRISTKKR